MTRLHKATLKIYCAKHLNPSFEFPSEFPFAHRKLEWKPKQCLDVFSRFSRVNPKTSRF